jgi:tripartite-type tricarboxylate transporter receptor subunit TctC
MDRRTTALSRRAFLTLGAATALPAVSRRAFAQTYPARPVRVIVGFAAGGGNDIVGRLIAQWLSERLGQTFVIENRPGANSSLATGLVTQVPPDGYTLLLISVSNTINSSLYDKLNYNFIRDIAPVALISRVPNVMVVQPSFPAKTIPEFITYAKAHPGTISMGSPGIGSPQHVACELFKMLAGVSMTHVPYRGLSPAVTDLLGGQIQTLFGTAPGSIEHIKFGKLRALAVSSASRWEGLPDVPAVSEFLPGFEATSWYGVGAPRNTPPEIIERLNKEINAGLADPALRARLIGLGGTVQAGSAADFGKLMVDETEKWAKVIRAASIKPE